MNPALSLNAYAVPAPRETKGQDQALVREFVRTGSDDVFALIVDRYKDRVFRLVCSVLGHGRTGEAEEVSQEIFLTVHDRLREFRHESSFSTWLYRISYRRAIDLKRRARYRLPHVGEAAIADLAESERDAYSSIAERQQAESVRQALQQVREPYRTVLYLHYWSGLPVAEIAEIQQKKIGTVKSHLFRGRKEMAGTLQEVSR